MKIATVIAIVLLALLAACSAQASDFTQKEAEKYLALAHEEEEIGQQLESATLAPDERTKLEARQKELEDSMDELERVVELRKNKGLVGAVGRVFGGPLGEAAAVALAAGLTPLLGPRGRRHAANLIKSATPGSGRPAKNLAADLAKYVGAMHSDPKPA